MPLDWKFQKKKKQQPVIKPKFEVATWKNGGLNLRAYFNQVGEPQWIFERVHQHLNGKCQGGTYLRRNMESLKSTMQAFQVPVTELSYKGLDYVASEEGPWADHTLSSRALLVVLFFIAKHKSSSAEGKVAAIALLLKLVASVMEALDNKPPPPVGLCLLDENGCLQRVEIFFTPQGVTDDWHQLASLNPATRALWEKLQTAPWCGQRITSSFQRPTLVDILLFLFYLVGHPKETFSSFNLFEDVGQPMLPDLIVWLGRLMDENARTLSSEPLEDLPLLKTKSGAFKRKADQVNKFILLDKLQQHKSSRRRIASTHTSLAAKHGDFVEREAHISVALYNDKVRQSFSSCPRQFSVAWDPSTYGGKNTLVSTLYSPEIDTVAYMPNQQLRRLQMSDLQDSFIEEAKASKLGTLEGYAELRCLSHALVQATGCSLDDFRIPPDLVARPLQLGEARVFFNGAWYTVGPGDLARLEIPNHLKLSDLPALSSCSDQGPSNTASLNFVMFAGEGMMVHVNYDYFHRGWNDVKNSAKKSLGYPWKAILQLVLLFNINYSPFQSGAFFYKKQGVMEDFMATRTRADPTFQAYISDICRERRQREPETPEEEEELFRSLASMTNFQKKGGLVKLMRWMSFFEVALEWRGDLWGTKLVLLSDQLKDTSVNEGPAELPQQMQEPQPGPQDEAGQSKMDAKKELNELKKAQGVWKLAPKMITQKNLATLDMLLLTCKSTWKLHAERARSIVQPQQVLEHNVASTRNKFWASELEDMVSNSLWSRDELRHMFQGQLADSFLAEHCDYFHNLLSARATSLAAAYTLPPMRWNGVLSLSNLEAEHTRSNLLKEWQLLLKLEAASLHTTGKVDALEKMYWRLGTYTRVLCMAHEQDQMKGLSCQDGSAFHLQRLLAQSLGDSRVIEVAHQQGPDLQRGNRHNHVPDVSIMFGTIKSGALELRNVKNTVAVDPQELIYQKNLRKVKVVDSMNPRSHKLGDGLQRMMRKRQGDNWWPSPAPSSLFPSVAATEWCLSYMDDEHPGSSIGDAWVSCIGGKCGDLVAHQPTGSLLKVVGAAEFGILTWHMDVSSNSTYFMRPNRMLLQWMHITDLKHWLHVPAKPFLSDAGIIEWALDGQPVPLAVAMVKNGISLNVAQMRKLLQLLQVPIPYGANKAGLQKLLIESVLVDDDEKRKAMESLESKSTEQPLDSDLEDVVSCLDGEDANTLDLKELKEKKRLKRYRKNAGANQQVPDRNRARGRGRGRGRPAGRGRGRGRGRFGRRNGSNQGDHPGQLPGEGASVPGPPGPADQHPEGLSGPTLGYGWGQVVWGVL